MSQISISAGAPTQTPLGSLQHPPGPLAGFKGPTSLPTCLLLTHVALCQRIRMRDHEDALYKCTDLLTYISSTIGCANFAPDWSLLFKVHDI